MSGSRFFCAVLRLCGLAFLSLFVTFSIHAWAQAQPREVALSEAVAIALRQDPQLRVAIASRDAGIEKEVIARGGLLPNLSATMTQYPNSVTETRIPNSTIPSQRGWFENRYSLESRSLVLRQPVIRLRNWATYLQGRVQTEQAQAQLRFERYEAIARVVEIYANWLHLERRMMAANARVKFTAERVAQSKGMRAGGQAAITDELRAQTEYRRAIFDLTELEKEFAFTKERFTQLLGFEARPRAVSAIPGAELQVGEIAHETKKNKLISDNPEIKAVELLVESARWDIKKFRADHYPTLDFVANYSEDNNATAVLLGRETRTSSYGFQLTVPIYQGGIVSSTVRQATAELARLQAQLEVTQQRVLNDLARLEAALKSALELYRFSDQQAQFARENLRSIIEQQRLGFATSVDVLQAQELLASSLADQIRAQSSWMISRVELLAISGQLDGFEGNEIQMLFGRQ